MNQGLFDFALPKVKWSGVPDISKLPSWRDAKRVGIDIETRDPDLKRMGPGVRRDRKTNYVVGVGVAIEDGPEFYLPFAHEGGDNVDRATVIQYLNDNLKEYRGVIAGAKLDYEGDWLHGDLGVDINSHDLRDVQVSDVLINELHDDYDLETVCARWNLPGKDERALREAASAYRVNPKSGLWQLPARYVDEYCRTDARRPLQVLRRQEAEMAKSGLEQIWDLERKVTGILTKMRIRGVRVDMGKVDQIEQKCLSIERDMCAKVKHATMVSVSPDDLMNAEALARALRVAGFEPSKTEKGKASVDKELLRDCGYIGEWLMEAREWHHLRITYCKQIRDHAIRHSDNDWRVHTTTNQVKATEDPGDAGGGGKKTSRGVRYGRTSCTTPSLQNQPIRNKKFGALWRSIFVKKLGSAGWACSDWSQQEPRIGVHYAELLRLPGAKEFADEYRKNPSLDVHSKLTELSKRPPEDRTIIKNYVNGRLYGMGDLKLCRQLRMPTEWTTIRGEYREIPGPECREVIRQFREFAPWIDGLTKSAAAAAKKNGVVWTWLRRRCNFPRNANGEIDFTHKAFNRVGQGTAADQMKATLVAADAEGIPVDLIVHDEFDFSYDDISQAKRLKELQMTVVKFNVPMKVDLEIGDNWGELEKVA